MATTGDTIGFKIPSGPHAGEVRAAIVARVVDEEAEEFDLYVIGVPGDGPEYYPPQLVPNRRKARSDSDAGWVDRTAQPLQQRQDQKDQGG